jgi:hypothetical protein
LPLRPLIRKGPFPQIGGGPKVIHALFWHAHGIQGLYGRAKPGELGELVKMEKEFEQHEHYHYGRNRKMRRQNPDYRLKVMGILSG